jgi:hypothetical protein
MEHDCVGAYYPRRPHEDPEHDWLFLDHQDDFRILATNADMMAILQARATVLLNPLFHDMPQQTMIVMLSMVALDL